MAKVIVACPVWGPVEADLALALIRISHDKRHDVSVVRNAQRPISSNRNEIAEWFLAETDHDWLCMIDSDNPPILNPLDLIEHDCDVVGCVTPLWKPVDGWKPTIWSAFVRKRGKLVQAPPGRGLVEVDALSTGCILIARRVLQKLMPRAFDDVFDDNGVMCLEHDLAFCQRAKDAGFKVWAHWDYRCHHYHKLDLLEVNDRFDSCIGHTRGWWTWIDEAKTFPLMDILHAEMIAKYARQAATIMLWGDGGSTIWLAQQCPSARIMVVEHNPEWLGWSERVCAALRGLVLMTPHVERFLVTDKDAYCRWKPPDGTPVDLVLVDGHDDWRGECLAWAVDGLNARHVFAHDAEWDAVTSAIEASSVRGRFTAEPYGTRLWEYHVPGQVHVSQSG